jgi:hypothetical protein
MKKQIELRFLYLIFLFFLSLIFSISCQSLPDYIRNAKRYEVLAQYKGENQRKEKPIVYFTPEERKAHLIYVKDGKAVDGQGKILDPEIQKYPKRSGFAIFVLTQEGDFIYSFDAEQQVLHHSTLNAAQAVIAAGDMLISNGEILKISNISGHYRPKPNSLDIVLQRLKELGLENTQSIELLRMGQ